MAGLERLVPHIYHEKQQEGSMLCAQHALNSLFRTSQRLIIHRVNRFLSLFYRGQLCALLDNLNICSSSEAEFKFSASDLSGIARSLDQLEESYDDSNTGNSSTNMDDTGNGCFVFFYLNIDVL